MTKFRHLPAAGRAIIVVVALGVFAVAVVACATSYNAIYRLVGMLDLYGYRMTQTFPLLLDAAFLIAELAAILGGIMRAVTRSDEVSAGWPWVTTVLCGLGTLGFNVGHAYLIGGRGDPLTVWRCIVAALPPVLMMLSFQVLIAIVKWTMLHLGRPLNSAAALSPTGATAALYGPPGVAYGAVPGAAGPGMHLPTWDTSGAGQIGHGNGEGIKRQRIEAYLAGLDADQLGRMTARELAGAMNDAGLDVSERYAGQILDAWTAQQRTPQQRTPTRRGRGRR